jgi:hypothetical protein
MPHWACHYYRLETGSSFIVGTWAFSPAESVASMVVYTALIALNVWSVVAAKPRLWAAVTTGVGHLAIGMVHVLRLAHPFRFEIFDHAWSIGASIREVIVVMGFGSLSLVVAARLRHGAA